MGARTIRVLEQAIELRCSNRIGADPKTGAGRPVVRLPARLVEILTDHVAPFVTPGPDALVFAADGGAGAPEQFPRQALAARDRRR
jgi:hypothetical protein